MQETDQNAVTEDKNNYQSQRLSEALCSYHPVNQGNVNKSYKPALERQTKGTCPSLPIIYLFILF